MSEEMRDDLRNFIVANMFDGDDAGIVQANIRTLVDEIVGVVMDWLGEEQQ